MPIWKDEVGVNGDDSVLITDLRKCRAIEDIDKDINKITLIFVGTGFLRYMVRNMVGLLIEIGEGKRKPEDIIEIFKHENRKFGQGKQLQLDLFHINQNNQFE